jgi:transcription factor TFIIIB component B''
MPSTLGPKKRPTANAKKRKVQVSIGSSRPEEPDEEEKEEEKEPVGELTEPHDVSITPVLAGNKPTLQTYCSKYRTKGKRQTPKKQKVIQKENDPTSSVSTGAEEEGSATATTAAGPVVQVVNGEIVLQESSMVVPGARRSVQEVEEEFEQVVEEDVQHSAVVGASYNSFVSRRAPQHWNVAETKKFYNALRQVGPDFATMAAYFDNRTRKQLKRKYQIENTKNPHLIELALSPQSQIPLGTNTNERK